MTSTAADEAPAALDAAIHNEVTAGAALRRAREARGLHIAALAATLKVPQAKLVSLEADRYNELPDATFARALARSMCRVLKIDAEPVLAMLPRGGNEASLDRVTPGLNQPFRERAASQEPVISAALLKSPVLLGGAALLAAALAVYLVPASVVEDLTKRFHREPDTSAQNGTTTEPLQVEAPTVPASGPVVTDATTPAQDASVAQAPATQAPVTQAPVTQAPITQAPITQAPAPAPSTPSALVSPAPAPAPAVNVAAAPAVATANTAGASSAGTAAAPSGAGLLRVRATGETWVEVTDSKGLMLMSRLLRSGEQVDLNGTAPLKLRVGNVSATELVFRGKPVDLASRARDNVARLELN